MMAASQRALLLLLIGSLAFPIELFRFSGIGLTATEFLFPLLLGLWATALAKGATTPPRWTDYRAILLYVGLIGAAALMASGGNAVRFAILLYSGGLAIVVGENSRSLQTLESPIKAWIAVSAVVSMMGVVAALLFFAGIRMEYAIHPYGTLAPGPYPRIDSTFDFPAMLTNYLSIAAIMTLFAAQTGWISRRTMCWTLAAVLICCAFTITPGLGGLALAVGAWMTLGARRTPWWLGGGMVLLLLSVLVAAVTPIPHPGATWQIEFLGQPFYPSVRWMTWTAALQTWSAHWLVGGGLTGAPIAVDYRDPSGNWHLLTDAHNVFLNVAAQSGGIGLAALFILIINVGAIRLKSPRGSLSQALAIAWLAAFVAQGLTGSYEDARHLWVLLGLIIAANRPQLSPDPVRP